MLKEQQRLITPEAQFDTAGPVGIEQRGVIAHQKSIVRLKLKLQFFEAPVVQGYKDQGLGPGKRGESLSGKHYAPGEPVTAPGVSLARRLEVFQGDGTPDAFINQYHLLGLQYCSISGGYPSQAEQAV